MQEPKRVENLSYHLSIIPDPRVDRGKEHSLHDGREEKGLCPCSARLFENGGKRPWPSFVTSPSMFSKATPPRSTASWATRKTLHGITLISFPSSDFNTFALPVVFLRLDRSAFRCYFPVMKYAVLIEPVEESEGMPGFYYAHVPSLGITTHGGGIEGAMAAARDLISLWVEEMRAVGKDPKTPESPSLQRLRWRNALQGKRGSPPLGACRIRGPQAKRLPCCPATC